MVAELINASEQTCESLCQASWGRQEVWRAGWHCPLYQPCKAGALQRKSVFCIIVIVKYRETGDCTKPCTLDIPEYRESRDHSRIIVNLGITPYYRESGDPLDIIVYSGTTHRVHQGLLYDISIARVCPCRYRVNQGLFTIRIIPRSA